MADKSKIEWTDATWNPLVGCSIVSPGCTSCYAMAHAARIERMAGAPHYAGTTEPSKAGPVWTGKVALASDQKLTEPLRWKRPRKIFVNSMGDLFHESVPDEWIDKVFAVMALAPQHIFQVLTKRPKRMREYLTTSNQNAGPPERADDICVAAMNLNEEMLSGGEYPFTEEQCFVQPDRWPLPNVWLGVTAEDQARADERIPDLLATPAVKRFVSCEPLLGPVDLNRIHEQGETAGGARWHSWESCLSGKRFDEWSDGETDGWPRLDWVIAGGESGPKARPSHPDWFRSLRDQCAAAGVPFFFKQWGAWAEIECPEPDDDGSNQDAYLDALDAAFKGNAAFVAVSRDGYRFTGSEHVNSGLGPSAFQRVVKRRAGALLDGREHKDFPV